MTNLTNKVAAAHFFRQLRLRTKAASNLMEAAFGNFDELVEAMSQEPDLMGDVIETLVNMGDLSYRDGAFYYKGSTRLSSTRRPILADETPKQSPSRARPLSDAFQRLEVGEKVEMAYTDDREAALDYLEEISKYYDLSEHGSTVLAGSYYDARRLDPDLEDVAQMWVEDGTKAYDANVHNYYKASELWPLREYTWTRDNSRPGRVELADGSWVDLPGPQKWDVLKKSMKKHGWPNDRQPLVLHFGKDGKVKVAEGNHRLAIALEIGLRDIPVRFIFYQKVDNGKRIL